MLSTAILMLAVSVAAVETENRPTGPQECFGYFSFYSGEWKGTIKTGDETQPCTWTIKPTPDNLCHLVYTTIGGKHVGQLLYGFDPKTEKWKGVGFSTDGGHSAALVDRPPRRKAQAGDSFKSKSEGSTQMVNQRRAMLCGRSWSRTPPRPRPSSARRGAGSRRWACGGHRPPQRSALAGPPGAASCRLRPVRSAAWTLTRTERRRRRDCGGGSRRGCVACGDSAAAVESGLRDTLSTTPDSRCRVRKARKAAGATPRWVGDIVSNPATRPSRDVNSRDGCLSG